jgi:hypothetical protein
MKTKKTKKIETKGSKSIRDYNLAECFNEARYVFGEGRCTAAGNSIYTKDQKLRIVALFFRIRELNGRTERLRDYGFSPGSIYRWIAKYGTDAEKATLRTPAPKAVGFPPFPPSQPEVTEKCDGCDACRCANEEPEEIEAEVTGEEPLVAQECARPSYVYPPPTEEDGGNYKPWWDSSSSEKPTTVEAVASKQSKDSKEGGSTSPRIAGPRPDKTSFFRKVGRALGLCD